MGKYVNLGFKNGFQLWSGYDVGGGGGEWRHGRERMEDSIKYNLMLMEYDKSVFFI